MYDADFGSQDGGKALGYATLRPLASQGPTLPYPVIFYLLLGVKLPRLSAFPDLQGEARFPTPPRSSS